MWQRISPWAAEAAAVFAKDWRCELRTRYALNTLGLFAVSTLVIVSFNLGPLGAASGEAEVLLPVLYWIILLFAATAGLPRLFVREVETHTATALRLAATPSALFCGKLAYGASLVLALELLLTPLYLILMELAVAEPALLVTALAAGGYGLAIASTLIATIVAQAQGRSTLFAVLAFPVLLPLLVMAIDLTRAAVTGEGGSTAVLGQLLLYDGSVTILGLMLFPAVWNP